MEKRKEYKLARFSADVLREASHKLRSRFKSASEGEARLSLAVEVDGATWEHDSLEEFFADYRRTQGYATYSETLGTRVSLAATYYSAFSSTQVSVEGPDRSGIEAVFDIFEKHLDDSRLPEPPTPPPPPIVRPTIFVGHGLSPSWRDLKDHLQDLHGYDVRAYEIGARAGHVIRDILQAMLNESTFAILIMTGEDKTREGDFLPRLNVVHELGLFQGGLGFSRAIMLVEEGTREFSNMQGVDQIRFARGNIKATFGDVLATLRREFPGTAG